MADKNDSVGRTLFIVVGLCLICSLVVSGSAVLLSPLQLENKIKEKQEYILQAAGFDIDGIVDINDFYEQHIHAQVIDLKTGKIVTDMDPKTIDIKALAANKDTSFIPQKDIASVRRISQYGLLYFVYNNNQLTSIIFPINGRGLWSMMYAFLALEPDMNTIQSLVYYDFSDSGETPGLGGEVQNPKWQALWHGKKLFNEQGKLVIAVSKGSYNDNQHVVDALSGATITSNGVQNSLRFWFSDEGYAHFITYFKNGEISYVR